LLSDGPTNVSLYLTYATVVACVELSGFSHLVLWSQEPDFDGAVWLGMD